RFGFAVERDLVGGDRNRTPDLRRWGRGPVSVRQLRGRLVRQTDGAVRIEERRFERRVRDVVDRQVVDLLEGRPDPLRRRSRLVTDVHADEPDFDIALIPLRRSPVRALAVDGRYDRGGREVATPVVALDQDTPREFELPGT